MTTVDRTTMHDFDDYESFFESAERHRWTDGLPLVPPTIDRVEAMVAASGFPSEHSLGALLPSGAPATIEKVAVNAVMAGCRPTYMPIVTTAVEAVMDPGFDLGSVQATTHPCGILVLVSGPRASELGINGRASAFGPGSRANATIGRAVRLVLQNIGGAHPGLTDNSTQGSPAKYSYCVTENLDDSPWPPYHVARGHEPASTTVTVASAESPQNINDHVSKEPVGLLHTIASTIATVGSNNAYCRDSDYFVALCPEHANLLDRHGFSRADVQQHIFDRARIPYSEWKVGGMFGMTPQPRWLDAADDEYQVAMTKRPDDVHILVTGGAGRHSSWLPTWGAGNRAVTREVEPTPAG